MYHSKCHVFGCSICGNIDVKTGECEFCLADNKICRLNRDCDFAVKSAYNEGMWLGVGIGFLVTGLLVYIMEYFVG